MSLKWLQWLPMWIINNRIIMLTDSLLLIGLDNYLGQSTSFNQGISKYIAIDWHEEIFDPWCSQCVLQLWVLSSGRTFLAQLYFFYGKELYLTEKRLGCLKVTHAIYNWVMNYEENLVMANANENRFGVYFIERQIFIQTNSKLDHDSFGSRPFRNFELELDNESLGKIRKVF